VKTVHHTDARDAVLPPMSGFAGKAVAVEDHALVRLLAKGISKTSAAAKSGSEWYSQAAHAQLDRRVPALQKLVANGIRRTCG